MILMYILPLVLLCLVQKGVTEHKTYEENEVEEMWEALSQMENGLKEHENHDDAQAYGDSSRGSSQNHPPPPPRPKRPLPIQPTISPKGEYTPHCGYGIPVCECLPEAKTCIFNLEVDELRTFTSYQKKPVSAADGFSVRGAQGTIYNIDNQGELVPWPYNDSRECSDVANIISGDCTEPQFVDGITYRMVFAVNGQVPGPNIIVHENQMVVINVHNNMTTEGTSVHWHGMHQKGTPWSDGVGQITQCQIGPSSTYTYIYLASPSGSFWYHSHSGAQRTDGFYGSMVVKERPHRIAEVLVELRKQGFVGTFEDLPGKHSINLLDWQHEPSLDLASQLADDIGLFPDLPIGQLPRPGDKRFFFSFSHDFSGIGSIPYFSGLINGKGRHEEVPYIQTRLSIFTVQRGNKYRFRLIGAQSQFAYKFSIDGHKLTVVNADGYWTQPRDADYIIIHTGERFDFIVDAKETKETYWIRAETMEIDPFSAGPPFKSLGHVTEAILQYTDGSIDNARKIHSREYECIKGDSQPPNCVQDGCIAINCPFKDFHDSYGIHCVNINDLKLLEPTIEEELPDTLPPDDCADCLQFINFHFEGDTFTGSANGRNFALPPVPPQTQNADFYQQATQCDHSSDCNPTTLDCSCTYVLQIPYNKTVQLVFSSIGAVASSHPIHLHGHTFQVAHVGYPEYNKTTGFITTHNTDIKCGDVNCQKEGCHRERCTQPSWADNVPRGPPFTVDKWSIRKDTVMVPAGGYVVINFISDNPGYWFIHCHIETHQLQGMAVILEEAPLQQQLLQPPVELNKCGDVSYTVSQYLQSLPQH